MVHSGMWECETIVSFCTLRGHYIMQEMKWLSMKEVCDYLHISRDTVMNWIKKEGMPAHQKGRLWRFDVNEIDEWMKTNEDSSINLNE